MNGDMQAITAEGLEQLKAELARLEGEERRGREGQRHLAELSSGVLHVEILSATGHIRETVALIQAWLSRSTIVA